MKWVQWIFGAALFSASFDIILVINLGGTFRFAQLLLIPLCLFAMARVLQDGRIIWPRGATALLLWLLAQFILLPNSGNLIIGAQFFTLLLFTICGYYAVIQLYAVSDFIQPLMRIYLYSYVFVACFGLLQFLTPLMGLPPIMVGQWIIHGRVPRINGFCFEPSYFATYMIMGWIMLIELLRSRSVLVAGKWWKPITVLVTVVLVLSTSKTAWGFMLLELALRVLPSVGRSLLHSLRQLQVGRILVPLPRARYLVVAVLAVCAILGALVELNKFTNPLILLAGSGIGNTPAHSVMERSHQAERTLQAFEDHPWVGRSLGGVPVYIAAQEGVSVSDRDAVRLFWGFPVLLDVLVASGIIGFIPFAIFLYTHTFGALRLARRYWPDERAKWLRALARAMIFEWMLLMVDQNILRVYLWFHFTMVAIVAYNLEFCRASEPSTAALPGLATCLPEASAA